MAGDANVTHRRFFRGTFSGNQGVDALKINFAKESDDRIYRHVNIRHNFMNKPG